MLTLAKAAVTTTTTATMPTLAALTVSGGEQQVRTLIPLTTSTGERFLVAGPCIVLKTSLPTVAQHLQALRPLLKADSSNRGNNPTATRADKTTATRARMRGLKGGFKKDDIVVGGSGNEPSALRCKRRIDFGSLGLPRPMPATMARRNERERNRVKQVNLGFETLRQHVPSGRQNKKLSKVDTLKEAVRYIKHLQQVLRDADPTESSGSAFLTTIADTIHLTSRGAVTSATGSDVTSALAVSDESVGATSASSSGVALMEDTSDVDFECEMSQTTEDEADDEDDDDFTSITPTLTFVPEIERLAAGSPFSHMAPSPVPSPGSPGTSTTTITTAASAVVFQHDHDSYNYLADRWCGGSDGASSPSSPSQSSCGASEISCDETNSTNCDPYHDLSPDLADWLCAKFDIADEDVFR